MYAQGQGVPKDNAEAVRWYRKAVDQNYAPAEYNLGRMYYYGQGVSQDRIEARHLLIKAADQGDQFALRFISVSLSSPRIFTLAIQFCFSLYLALDFLSLGPWMPGKSFKSLGQKWVTATGVIGLLDVGLVWYACTHSLMRRLAYGITPITWLHWSLYAIFFAVVVFTALKRKNTAQQTGTAGDEFPTS
jgi:Sel1 repeat